MERERRRGEDEETRRDVHESIEWNGDNERVGAGGLKRMWNDVNRR